MKILSTLLALCAVACLVPQTSAQTSNTIVRFQFYRGTTVIGNVDMEMFDYEKPVTVSNFLRYVRSGAYHNLVLNRCLPNFVIQAGALWTPTPASAAAFFQDLKLTPTFGQITNEFSVGRPESNVFGTIAMARMGGETNSASSEFFFNLADNNTTNSLYRTDLDNVDGGFTVFGRLVEGAPVLDYFNHPSPTLNFLHLGGYYSDLPVGVASRPCTTVANCPRSLDLYHIKISILPTNDIVPPKVTVTYPRPNEIFTTNFITLTGTASDNQGVSSILYLVGDRPFTNALGGTNWSINVELGAGTNLLLVSSVDGAGQRSALDRRSVFYKVPEPLSLTTNGSGSVFGATNLQKFDITKFVTLTARPAAGHLFGRWTGSYIYPPARITFPMHTNAVLTANFVPNPFPAMRGTYSGLFYNTNAPGQPNGSITFSVTDLGNVSGRLNAAGRTLPFSGTISPYGEANIPVSVASLFGVRWNWYIVFNLDVTNRTDRLLPSDATGYPYVWDPTGISVREPTGMIRVIAPQFASALSVQRVRAHTNFTGKYTVAFPGGDNSPLFHGSEIYSLSNLVGKLVAHTNVISEFLWSGFSPEVQSVLANTNATASEQQSNVVAAFNQVLQGPSIYDATRFAGIALSAETVALRARNPGGPDLVRLNRLLLQDAYPEHIARILLPRPEGDSFGTVNVTAAGVGTVIGSLSDGTPFVMSAPVTTNGLWPLYTGLYASRGWLYGWNQFDLGNPASQLRADLRWRRSAFASPVYPGGFELFPTLYGSTYVTPGPTNRILSFSNGVVELAGPNLPNPVTNHVVINPNNTVVNAPPSTNRLTFVVVKPSGAFSGTVKPVGETRTIPFKGVLLKSQDYGAGYYLSTNQSGRVYFGQ